MASSQAGADWALTCKLSNKTSAITSLTRVGNNGFSITMTLRALGSDIKCLQPRKQVSPRNQVSPRP